MKTVFTNSEIVHVFNEQNQYEGRTSNGSMYFYNDKIFSYGSHYILGHFIDEKTIIINNKGYSNTTSNHISLIRNATRDKKQYFTNFIETETVLNDTLNDLKKLSGARSLNTKNYLTRQLNERFAMYFDFITYKKQKTEKNKLKSHREIKRLYNSFNNDFEALKVSLKETAKKQALKEKLKLQKKLSQWRNHEIKYFNSNTKNDYLRISGENIETSQSVKIPINEAKRLLKLIDLKKIVGQRVNNRFIVKSFNEFLTIGCHNISLKEINLIRTQLN
jgi:hypothetical protein